MILRTRSLCCSTRSIVVWNLCSVFIILLFSATPTKAANVHTFRCSVLNDDTDEANNAAPSQALCSFVVEKEASSASSSSSVSAAAAPPTSAPTTTTMEHCMEDYCVQVTVQTIPQRQPSTTTTSTTSTKNTTPESPSSSPTLTGEVRSLIKRTAKGIQVGDHTYLRPFSQYGELVEQALKGLLEVASYSAAATTSAVMTISSMEKLQEQAFWLVELGLAHRLIITTTKATITSGDKVDTNVELSLNAFHQAHSLYERLLQQQKQLYQAGYTVSSSGATNSPASRQADDIVEQQLWALQTQVELANVHFNLGESYILHPQLDKRALEHYRESERIFRELIQGEEATSAGAKSLVAYDVSDLYFNWAEACRQLGSYLLNSNFSPEAYSELQGVAELGPAETTTTTTMTGTTKTITRRTTRINFASSSGGGGGGGAGPLVALQQQKQRQQLLLLWNDMLKNAKDANGFFEKAISVYRNQLKDLSSPKSSKQQSQQHAHRSTRSNNAAWLHDSYGEDYHEEEELANSYKMKLATALQDSGTALTVMASSLSPSSSTSEASGTSLTKSFFEQALERQEESLSLLRQVLAYVEKTNTNDKNKKDTGRAFIATDLIASIANNLYGLSDLHLQLGQYDQAQKRYEDTMQWYIQYEKELPIPVAMDQGMMVDAGDGSLEAYEQTLEEYHEQLNQAAARRLEDESHGGGSGNGGKIYQDADDGTMDMDIDGSAASAWPLESLGDETYEGDLHAALGNLRSARGETAQAIGHFDQAIRLYRSSPFLSGDDEDRSVADVQFSWAMALFRAGEYKQSAVMHGQALEGYRKVVGEGKNPVANGMFGGAAGGVDFDEEELLMESYGLSASSASESSKVETATGSKDTATTDSPSVPLIDLSHFQNSILNATTGDEL